MEEERRDEKLTRERLQEEEQEGPELGVCKISERNQCENKYGLQYDKKGKVGAQALADFVVELTPEVGERVNTQWTLFVDGSSNESGSGAGVKLQGPGELVLEQSLRFQFKASNNQAEYEALIAGLKLAIEVKIDSLLVRTYSLLVANQVNEVFQVKEPALIKYLERFWLLMSRLKEIVVEFVPRTQNQRADALAKLASTRKPRNNRSVIQETLANPSIEGELVASVDRQNTWMDPIADILAGEPSGVMRYTKEQIREAGHYTLLDGTLFRRGFSSLLLRCLPPGKYESVMAEVHGGVCASHIGGRSLASKVLRAEFYWPTIRKDCAEFVKKCEKSQMFADLPKAPPEQLATISSPWPFTMWGVDLVGPFPTARSQMKFILVAVDYFTKWVEAEPLASITAGKIVKFYWKKIMCRFGVPRAIVSDNGTQFASNQAREFCEEMGI
ncbi:uncharacterized protein LOC130736179 [Lotus japonicus]|uniref:uncharacterized protein LOC130736179 n=1 Tax=Lotus japonicus TaxID=34305 RepID=UPI0025862AF6|nr:uncharacterized protein LOC130736179 [Lotus japonicus]